MERPQAADQRVSQTQKKAAESDGETEDREWLRMAQLLSTAP